jgi:cation:H+ antiporter
MLTIDASLKLAQIYRLSDLFVGLVILAIGSDLPELIVAISASLDSLAGNDMSGIIMGTSIGSAYTQIGFVLGFTGLITYVLASKKDIYLVGSILLISVILLVITGHDSIIDATDGAILILVYCIYLAVIFFDHRSSADEQSHVHSAFKSWLCLLVGLGLIAVSAEMTVQSAAEIAQSLDVSQSVIAVMIIGPGTSLPEFAISLRAIISKRKSISIGNILGSNVFDTLVPIGAAALITPVLVEPSFIVFDFPGLFLLTFVCLFFLVRKKGIQKFEAIIILSLYFAYLLAKLV